MIQACYKKTKKLTRDGWKVEEDGESKKEYCVHQESGAVVLHFDDMIKMDNVFIAETQSDAFDGDFVEGVIRNSVFMDLGNDGIDISGSNIRVENVKIIRAGDKGLSGCPTSIIVASQRSTL